MRVVKNMIRPFFAKLIIFLTSFALSILVAEFVLDKLFEKYQMPHTYSAFQNLNGGQISDFNERFLAQIDRRFDDYKDYYQQFRELPSDTEIVTIGDSFTNGGNVLWHQTYPFQLFLKLGKKHPVSNLGMCEDVTKGTYLRLKSYFEKTGNLKKKYIVIVLVGAADMFYGFSQGVDYFYEKYIQNDAFLEVVPFKIEEDLNFFEQLKTIKLAKFLYYWSKEKISFFYHDASIKDDPLNKKLTECFVDNASTRASCFENIIQKIKASQEKPLSQPQIRRIAQSIIYNNTMIGYRKDERIIEDLLTLSHIVPAAITHPRVIVSIFTYVSRQSKYDLKEHVLPLLKKFLENDTSSSLSKQNDRNDGLSIIKSLETYYSKIDHAYALQDEYHKKIISLVREKGGKLVFLTYPMNYNIINKRILNLAKTDSNVHVIDIEKIFSELVNKQGILEQELIDDWQHCTPKGYEIIASAVSDKIPEIAKKR